MPRRVIMLVHCTGSGAMDGVNEDSVLTFFMIPAFRFEKVMWRRDLS